MGGFSKGIGFHFSYTLALGIGILFIYTRCTKSHADLENNPYSTLTEYDSIYLFGSESSLVSCVDSMLISNFSNKESIAFTNMVSHINYFSSAPQKTKLHYEQYCKGIPDTNDSSLLTFDYLLYNIPESINIERFKACADESLYWHRIYKYNRIAQYYLDVDLELDSARLYFLRSYDLLKGHSKITREHFRTYEGLIKMSPILRKHHEGIYFSNLLCDFDNYVNTPDSLMQARALLLRAGMLFREGDYEGSYLDDSLAFRLLDTTVHTYEFQKYLENELVLTNNVAGKTADIKALLGRLEKNVYTTGLDITNVYRLKGRSLLDIGQYKEAILELEKAYQMAMNYHFFSVKHFSYICSCLANCYTALGLPDQAIRYIESDIKYSGGRLKPNKKQTAYSFYNQLGIAEIYFSTYQKNHKIENLYKVAALLNKIDSIMWDEYKVTDEQAIMQFYWETGNKFFSLGVNTIYILYQTTGNSEYLVQFLKYADMRKSSLMYRDQVLSTKSKENNNAVQEKQLLLTAQMKEAYLKGARANSSFDHIVENFMSHERNIEKQPPAARGDFKVISLKEFNVNDIMARLKADESIWDIVQSESDIYYTIITNENVKVNKIQLDERSINKLQEYFTSDNLWDENFMIPISQQLIPIDLRKSLLKKIKIIPDGFFHRLPLAYLLGDAYKVTYLPSFKFILDAHATSQKNELTKWAVFAFSDKNTVIQNADIGLPELPGTYIEAIKIRKDHPSAIMYTGKEATKENFIKAYTNPAITSIHLATHGYAVSHKKEDVKLYFRTKSGGIDSLYGYDLLRYKSTVQHITLLACDSGKGKIVDGEGNYTLARYFIINGAKEVVSSLQKMKDFNADEGAMVRYKLE